MLFPNWIKKKFIKKCQEEEWNQIYDVDNAEEAIDILVTKL